MMEHAPKVEPELVPVVSEEIRKPKLEVRVYKPEETWEDRLAKMPPAVSRMDEAVLIELQREGWNVEFQVEYCVLSTTVDLKINAMPDGRRVNSVVYLDGIEAHKGREDRDEQLGELLNKRYGLRVVSIPYERYSERARDEVVERIHEVFR